MKITLQRGEGTKRVPESLVSGELSESWPKKQNKKKHTFDAANVAVWGT